MRRLDVPARPHFVSKGIGSVAEVIRQRATSVRLNAPIVAFARLALGSCSVWCRYSNSSLARTPTSNHNTCCLEGLRSSLCVLKCFHRRANTADMSVPRSCERQHLGDRGRNHRLICAMRTGLNSRLFPKLPRQIQCKRCGI